MPTEKHFVCLRIRGVDGPVDARAADPASVRAIAARLDRMAPR